MRTARHGSYLFLLLTAALARADAPDWFPFVIPWDDSAPGAPDVSALNPGPAGGNGFLSTKDGRFVDEKGQRVRFLGVNICHSACFPDKADAPKIAARLRKYGINIVRLCAMDYYHAPRGIFDPRFKDKQHLDAGQLDRLDYFVYQLKRHGIYSNLGLHVARHLGAADGFPDADRLPGLGAVVSYFEPRMIQLHKDYARDLLTHYNPYTKTRYVEEPAVAVVELTNENTLVGMAWGDTLDKLPPRYRGELARQWNAWLKKRYPDTAALKTAWSGGAASGENLLRNGNFTQGAAGWKLESQPGARATIKAPADGAPREAGGRVLRVEVTAAGKAAWHLLLHQPGVDVKDGQVHTLTFWARADRKRPFSVSAALDQADYRNVGLAKPLTVGTTWQSFKLTFTPAKSVKGHVRLMFGLGQQAGTVELAGVTLRAGAESGLPAGATLEAGTIPPGRVLATPAGRDWIAFLMDTEGRYAATLRDHVKKDLGARANVTCSQVRWGGLGGAYRERLSDYADMHAYWQHPEFPRKAWDPNDWRIKNTAMTRDAQGGTLAGLARHRLAGMPFTVSEYNHSAPNDYQAECLPMLAAFAALQDWDGIYLFDYNSNRDTWRDHRIRGFFSVDSNPSKMAFLPAAAMLFLRSDVAPIEAECQLLVPEESTAEQMASKGRDIGLFWEAAGNRSLEALSRRLSVAFTPGEQGLPTLRRSAGQPPAGPIRWQGGSDRALFTVDTARSKVLVGFAGGQAVALSGWRVEMPKTETNFAALTLTSLDGRPAAESRSLLLTAGGRVENSGMGWNADRTSVGNRWGKGPVRAEGIPAAVRLDTQAKTATVYALEATGKRARRVDSTLQGGQLTFTIGPTYRTLWYEVETDASPPAGN